MNENESLKHGNIAIYHSKKSLLKVEVQLENETVWLSQKQMAVLFDKNLRTVNEHIINNRVVERLKLENVREKR